MLLAPEARGRLNSKLLLGVNLYGYDYHDLVNDSSYFLFKLMLVKESRCCNRQRLPRLAEDVSSCHILWLPSFRTLFPVHRQLYLEASCILSFPSGQWNTPSFVGTSLHLVDTCATRTCENIRGWCGSLGNRAGITCLFVCSCFNEK